MESKFHLIDEIKFIPNTLLIRLNSLYEGEPDGLVGLPLTITENSSSFTVRFSSVGNFRVLNEPFNELEKPYEEVEPFLLRMIESAYLNKYRNSATNFIHDIDYDADARHFVVYGENFVVDVISTEEPTVVETKGLMD